MLIWTLVQEEVAWFDEREPGYLSCRGSDKTISCNAPVYEVMPSGGDRLGQARAALLFRDTPLTSMIFAL